MTDIWQHALSHLRERVSTQNFDSWFRNIRLVGRDADTVRLGVGDEFLKAWIEENYLDLLENALEAVCDGPVDVAIVVPDQAERDRASQPNLQTIDAPEVPLAARQARMPDSGRIDWAGADVVEPPPATAPPAGRSAADIHDKIVAAGLNPRYTFDEFVVGSSNQFVHAACQAVANNPAQSYNPLFIFGGVGLGKTHLLQAVGIEVLKRRPEARIVNLSSEDFMNQLITSLRQKDMNSFRMQFRNNCDVLLIDDIQFIAGKDSTQEEFFHTFNALYHSGKQIVITSDQLPKDLPGVEERLRSRFSWGLCADIQPPEMETRIAILEKKAEADGIAIDKEVAILLASSIRSNVRELEGTLIRVGAQASLMGQPITVDLVRDMLDRMNIEQGREVNTDTIIEVVSKAYDITPADMRGSRRTRAISKPRQYAMYLARQHTGESFPELGRKFGGKDHTTVLAAFRKIEGLLQDGDRDMEEIIEDLEAKLFR